MTDEIVKPLDNYYGFTDAGYYKHEWTCDNCFKRFLKQIKKGNRIPKTVECPGCGCRTSGKIYG